MCMRKVHHFDKNIVTMQKMKGIFEITITRMKM